MFLSNIAFIALSLVAIVPNALAVPSSKISQRRVGVHCGTTADATLSDCQQLVTPGTWDIAWAGSSNVCQLSGCVNPRFFHGIIDTPPQYSYGLGAVAYNVACYGNCKSSKPYFCPGRQAL